MLDLLTIREHKVSHPEDDDFESSEDEGPFNYDFTSKTWKKEETKKQKTEMVPKLLIH